MLKKLISVSCIALFSIAAWGQGIVDVFVSDNTLELKIDFGGVIDADVTVEFENVDGLAPGALGITVEQIDPTSAALLSRLPSGGLVSIPAAFPIKLSIAPPAGSDLMMRGAVVVAFHTHNLSYTPGTPLRLFKASHGGSFYDITDRMGSGSYRVRGSGGEFSEFMILADLRPTATVVLDKFSKLNALLSTHQAEMNATLHGLLNGLVSTAQTSYGTNSFADAITQLKDFEVLVKKSTGGEIPDAWRPSGDLTNVAGVLRAASRSLNFSLSLLANNL